jgi:hypothetical protein
MIKRVGFVILVTGVMGCAITKPVTLVGAKGDPDSVVLAIRVENTTDVDFEEVTVVHGATQSKPGETIEYGRVAAGGTSPYYATEHAYRYPARLIVQYETGSSFVMAIDFVGEKLLAPGRYTYRLVWWDNPGSATPQVATDLVIDEVK